jgi:hypothetical protein
MIEENGRYLALAIPAHSGQKWELAESAPEASAPELVMLRGARR